MVLRRHPPDLTDKRPVLDAMGRCRKVLMEAMDKVTPFGPCFKVLQAVTVAIDAAAVYLTGHPNYYQHPGNFGPPGRWEDSGT